MPIISKRQNRENYSKPGLGHGSAFREKIMNILFGVSSVGLGHVRRSLAIARQLKEKTGVEIEFVCAEPALSFFRKENKRILSVTYRLSSLSEVLERYEKGGRFFITWVRKDADR